MEQEKPPKKPTNSFSEEEIRAKALQIWKARIGAHSPDDDWNEAIKILTAEQNRRSPVRWIKALLKGTWRWTGLGDKKLWDILQLLIVPIVLAGVAVGLQEYAKQREEKQQKEEKAKEQQLAADKANQETLARYLDQMAASLKDGLLDTKPSYETFIVAQARTVTTLQALDSYRQHLVIQFLNTAKPDDSESPNKNSNWKGLLYGARMYKANFRGSDLSGAPFNGIILNSSTLIDANFRYATLSNANLDYVNLSGADLSHANLNGASLLDAILNNADLTGANLIKSTNWDEDQLSKAKLCKTRLPEGSSLNPDRDCNP